MKYPYPILDWQKDKYPEPDDLDLDQWKWEFLRRNPEYQKLYDKFKSCPDNMTCPDGTISNKNGKWKGTPWQGMRFFVDGYFYASPEPCTGETLEDFLCRTGGVWPMPFADFLVKNFRITPLPVDPSASLPLARRFSDDFGEDSIPPWVADLSYAPGWEDARKQHSKTDGRVAIVFDLGASIDKQLAKAKKILAEEKQQVLEEIEAEAINPPVLEIKKYPNVRKIEYPRYIRILDALAVGALPKDMPPVIFPLKPNDYDHGYSANNNIAGNIIAAEKLRDGEYWKIGL